MKKLIILMLGMMFVVVGCDKETSEKQKSDPIKIGVITPLTGDGASYGRATQRGVQLALGNDAGYGVIFEDSKLNQKDSVSAIKKLIHKDNVNVILGPFASSNVLAVAPIAEKSKILLITASATADSINDAGQYIFRNVPANKMQGIKAANFITNGLQKNSVYIYHMYNDYGLSLKEAFLNRAKELKLTISGTDSFQPKETNFKNALLKIKNNNPDVIFFPGHYKECATILKQAKELGLTAIFVGTDGAYSPELVKIAKNSAEGSYYTLMSVNKSNTAYIEFEKEYEKTYSEKPDTYAIYAYDAFNIIKKALKDKDPLQTLKTESFDTVSLGKIKFNEYGGVDSGYSIYTVSSGEFVIYK